MRRLLHRRSALLFPLRPDWILQLCVLLAERRETPVTSGASRGETDANNLFFTASFRIVLIDLELDMEGQDIIDHFCTSSACRRPKESEGHTSIHQSAGY